MRDNLAVDEKDLKFKYLKLMSNQYKTISEASTEISIFYQTYTESMSPLSMF